MTLKQLGDIDHNDMFPCQGYNLVRREEPQFINDTYKVIGIKLLDVRNSNTGMYKILSFNDGNKQIDLIITITNLALIFLNKEEALAERNRLNSIEEQFEYGEIE